MSILCELGLGVGWILKTHTHTQILWHLKAPTQNPYPNTEKIPHPYPYPYPYPNTQKISLQSIKNIEINKEAWKINYKLLILLSIWVWVVGMGMGFFECLGMGMGMGMGVGFFQYSGMGFG